MRKNSTGSAGEKAACAFLEKKGFKIAEKNYNCKIAEIDIIAYDIDRTLCFIEVKTRKNADYGRPYEFVNSRKQHKMKLGAQCYIKGKNIDCEIRFDIVEVYAHILDNTVKITGINHIENAF